MLTYVDEVADGTYRVEARIPGLPTTFSMYFIKNGPGVLIEPGPAALVSTVQAAVNHLGISDLKSIEILGEPIAKVKKKFRTSALSRFLVHLG